MYRFLIIGKELKLRSSGLRIIYPCFTSLNRFTPFNFRIFINLKDMHVNNFAI